MVHTYCHFTEVQVHTEICLDKFFVPTVVKSSLPPVFYPPNISINLSSQGHLYHLDSTMLHRVDPQISLASVSQHVKVSQLSLAWVEPK